MRARLAGLVATVAALFRRAPKRTVIETPLKAQPARLHGDPYRRKRIANSYTRFLAHKPMLRTLVGTRKDGDPLLEYAYRRAAAWAELHDMWGKRMRAARA